MLIYAPRGSIQKTWPKKIKNKNDIACSKDSITFKNLFRDGSALCSKRCKENKFSFQYKHRLFTLLKVQTGCALPNNPINARHQNQAFFPYLPQVIPLQAWTKSITNPLPRNIHQNQANLETRREKTSRQHDKKTIKDMIIWCPCLPYG